MWMRLASGRRVLHGQGMHAAPRPSPSFQGDCTRRALWGSCTRSHRLNSKRPGNPLQTLKEKIRDQYRVRLILDNLPITTYDLEDEPESIRPGFQVRAQCVVQGPPEIA